MQQEQESQQQPQTSTHKIQIPNELICNPEISVNATYLYIHLKMRYEYKTKIFKMQTKDLLLILNWEKRMLKKYLAELKDHNFIKYKFDNLPKQNPLEIKIPLPPEPTDPKYKGYTQVPKTIINLVYKIAEEVPIRIKDGINPKTGKAKYKVSEHKRLREYAIRLLFLYKKFDTISENNTEERKFNIWLSYDDTQQYMKIRSTYHKGIDSIFIKNKIVEKKPKDTYTTDDGQEYYEKGKYTILF